MLDARRGVSVACAGRASDVKTRAYTPRALICREMLILRVTLRLRRELLDYRDEVYAISVYENCYARATITLSAR